MDKETRCLADIISKLSKSLGLEESIYLLFEYIKDIIPLQRIFCYHCDRKASTMNIFIDYSPESKDFKENITKTTQIFNWDFLERRMFNKENPIIQTSNITESSWYYSSNFSLIIQSALSLLIYSSKEEEIIRTITISHTQADMYTNEHLEKLMLLNPILSELVNAYYLSKPDPYLLLSADGAFSSSPEILLRNCRGLKNVVSLVNAVAPMQSTVLIQGETGSGKELVAEAIHALSSSSKGPLIRVNCGAIPDTLIDSEFFGAEKGSYTGATTTKYGYFEQAHNGTIYLDEIGELSLSAQVRLLRILEHKVVNRIGAAKSIPIKTRVIAATNKDLWKMVHQGTFREDLCYRLNIFPIFIPPLRERKEDIPVLVEHFYKFYLHEMSPKNPPILTKQAVKKLCNENWMGNVRQLKYTIERAMIISISSNSKELIFNDAIALSPTNPTEASPHLQTKLTKRDINLYSKITQALTQANNRIQGKGGAADILGISPSTLRSRMQKYGIPLPRAKIANADSSL